MKIEKIRIRNFRNLHQVYYEAHPGLNLFLGGNAQGKTSFLESIYMFSRPVSFRPAKDCDMLEYGGAQFFLEAVCSQGDERYKLAVQFQRSKNRKEFLCNGKKSNYKDPHRLSLVLFTPDDLYLVKGTPGRRRRFLDFMLCQLYPDYEKNFSSYQALLKKRNQLLRGQKRRSAGFDAVNSLFIQSAAAILEQRIHLSARLDYAAQEIFPKVYAPEMQFHVRYALSFPYPFVALKKEGLAREFSRRLQELAPREDHMRRTLAGPHLDDLNIYLNGRPARSFASQGQQRSAAVTLKMAEVQMYRQIRGEVPVVLLDEVFSELDQQKQQLLYSWLETADFQSFLTAVHLDGIQQQEPGKIKITRFHQGDME